MSKILFLLIFIEISLGIKYDFSKHLNYIGNSAPKINKIENYIDHNFPIFGKFSQRYFQLMDFFDSNNPKAILYFCGEVPCGLPGPKSLPYMLAENLKAAYFAIEHRFYGESQPFNNWETENLRFLTPDQALFDSAYLIEKINDEIMKEYNKKPKWLVISGSYPGALVAWFRYKFPHLTEAAIASSAVINTFLEFPKFEHQFIEDLNSCPNGEQSDTIRAYLKYSNEIMLSGDQKKRAEFLQLFGLQKNDMEMLDFAYFFADLATYPLMLGKLNEICEILSKLKNSGKTVPQQIKEWYEQINKMMGFNIKYYKFEHLQNTTVDYNKFDRQWLYQACSTFGWFQTPDFPNPMRWEGMNLEYWGKYCEKVFGKINLPNISHTNTMFGEYSIAKFGTNIYFTNGGLDGWQWAGMRENIYNNDKIVVELIKGVGHCADLHMEKDEDPEWLKNTRKREIEYAKKWLE